MFGSNRPGRCAHAPLNHTSSTNGAAGHWRGQASTMVVLFAPVALDRYIAMSAAWRRASPLAARSVGRGTLPRCWR